MIVPAKHVYRRITKFGHLGDVISAVQWMEIYRRKISSVILDEIATQQNQYYLFSNHICRCCGQNTNAILKDVIELCNTKVKYVDWKELNFSIVKWGEAGVPYFCGETIRYVKSKHLFVDKGNHITVQLVCRSDRGRNNIDPRQLLKLLSGYNVQNIGDFHLPGTIHMPGNIFEKFKLIASAKLHIGVDSGTAHLASMSETPTVVICQPKYFDRYAKQDNVRMFTHVDHAIPYIKEILVRDRKNKIQLI